MSSYTVAGVGDVESVPEIAGRHDGRPGVLQVQPHDPGLDSRLIGPGGRDEGTCESKLPEIAPRHRYVYRLPAAAQPAYCSSTVNLIGCSSSLGSGPPVLIMSAYRPALIVPGTLNLIRA